MIRKQMSFSLRTFPITLGLSGMFFILFNIIPAFAQGRIQHIPVVASFQDKSIIIEATVEGAPSTPLAGRIMYRSAGKLAFLPEEMRVQQHQLYGEIPSQAVTVPEVEYYLEIELADGSIMTLPDGAPQSNQPFRIDVRSSTAGGTVGKGINILHPEPNRTVHDDDLFIAVSFVQGVRKTDPSNVRILLNGVDITKQAVITEDVLTVTVKNVKSGNQFISIYEIKDNVRTDLASWGISMRSLRERAQMEFPVNGVFTAGYSHEDISERTRNISAFDGRVYGSLNKKMDWYGRVYLTSLEKDNIQPQNRYLGSISNKWLTLRVGDTTPRFSEFTYWGVRSRGGEFNLRSSFFNLDIAYGQIRRSVEGRIDTITVPGAERRIYGTYSRNLLAIRPGVPLSKNSAWSFNIVKIKDDMESIELGAAPKDNLVLGSDMKIQSANRRMTFTGEVAVSLFNDDISSGPVDNTKDIKDIIVFNRYFDPLPANSDILEKDLSISKSASILIEELMKSALAYRGAINLNYYHNELLFTYKSVGRSYRSLGSPAILTDEQGFGVQDRIRLMNNRLYLTLGFESYNNNVNKRNPTTTDRNVIRGTISYYSPPGMPNLSFGIRDYKRSNDGTERLVVMPDTTFTFDNRIDQNTTTYNIWIDQSFWWQGFYHTAALSYSTNNTTDKIFTGQDALVNAISLSLNSRAGLLETQLQYSNSSQESFSGALDNAYNTLNGSARYALIKNQLYANGGITMSFADGLNDPVVALPDTNTIEPPEQRWIIADQTPRINKLDYSRTQLYFGVDYRLNRMHEFNFSLSKAFHDDRGYTTFYSDRRVNTKDTSANQDDFTVQLRYTLTL